MDSSEEQRGHAEEMVAENRAEQERCGGGIKWLSSRGGGQGQRGSSWDAGSQAAVKSCVCVGSLVCCSSCSPHQIHGWLRSLRDGGKSRLHMGPTALGLAHGRSTHDRFIHFLPSRCTLRVQLNRFVMVALGPFVSR